MYVGTMTRMHLRIESKPLLNPFLLEILNLPITPNAVFRTRLMPVLGRRPSISGPKRRSRYGFSSTSAASCIDMTQCKIASTFYKMSMVRAE